MRKLFASEMTPSLKYSAPNPFAVEAFCMALFYFGWHILHVTVPYFSLTTISYAHTYAQSLRTEIKS